MNSLMWYKKPASEWKEGLPIGNGVLAGMVMGGVEHERVALNHEWLWRGKNRKRDIEPKYQRLEEIRRLFFEEKVFEAGTLANETLGGLGGVLRSEGKKNRIDPYQPLGDLFLNFNHKNVSDYKRQLDMDKAVISISYAADGKYFLREFFAHSIHRVIVIHLIAEGTTFDTGITLSRIKDPECQIEQWAKESSFGFAGEFVEGVKFAVEVRCFLKGGSLNIFSKDKAEVNIKNCSEALFLLTSVVSLNGEDPLIQCEKQFNSVPVTWDELVSTHVEEYQRRFGRVSLEFEKSHDEIPTEERLNEFRCGKEDNSLYALLFNFGRYLLISSSWGAEVPANLQGKWNEKLNPPWECDLHHDINFEMNYWPAEVCNLTECTEPFFKHVERLIPHGKEVAKKLYNCDGIYIPLTADPWGRATPESRGWDVWTGAAAWLAQHFWWHYEYTLDKEFLKKRAYQLFKEVAAFYETYLVRDPNTGFLVPVPSYSPENIFVGGTTPVSLCIGATMDLELIYDSLTHAIHTSEILNVDKEKRAKWHQILKELPPFKIGRYGQLQEWLEDYEEVDPGFPHTSHLFALYPGDQITVEETPKLANASEVALERRIAHGYGKIAGYCAAWAACCFARLQKGDKALQSLKLILSGLITDTFLDLVLSAAFSRIFQIDGNFGATSAVAEMLLQSHKGVIRILPALPSSWQDGKVTGLCARGGFVVDIEWEDGKPEKVSILSKSGETCRLKFPSAANIVLALEDKVLFESGKGMDALEFDTDAKKQYEVKLS